MADKPIKEQINKLRQRNLSIGGISRELQVSVATVKYYLRQTRDNKEVLSFAAKLQQLVSDAPSGHCRHELTRTIHRITKLTQARFELLYPVFLKLLEDGCETVLDFQDETRLSAATVWRILEEMEKQKLIRKIKDDSGTRRFPNRYRKIL